MPIPPPPPQWRMAGKRAGCRQRCVRPFCVFLLPEFNLNPTRPSPTLCVLQCTPALLDPTADAAAGIRIRQRGANVGHAVHQHQWPGVGWPWRMQAKKLKGCAQLDQAAANCVAGGGGLCPCVHASAPTKACLGESPLDEVLRILRQRDWRRCIATVFWMLRSLFEGLLGSIWLRTLAPGRCAPWPVFL